MDKYYECHITVEDGNEYLMRTILARNTHWNFSQITDDIILGPGNKQYATAHFPAENIKYVRKQLDMVESQLKESGLKVVRKKIELVIYDVKY